MYLYSYNRPFECNHNANVARDEIEFDTPALNPLHSYWPLFLSQ